MDFIDTDVDFDFKISKKDRSTLTHHDYVHKESHLIFLIIVIIIIFCLTIVYYVNSIHSYDTTAMLNSFKSFQKKFKNKLVKTNSYNDKELNQNFINKVTNYEQKTKTHNYVNIIENSNDLDNVVENILLNSVNNIDINLFEYISNPKIIKCSSQTKTSIDIILAYYKSDIFWFLEMLKKLDRNSFRLFVYYKGGDFNNSNVQNELLSYAHSWINLDNIGRDMHTYVYHIINNYNQELSEKTFFVKDSGVRHMNNKDDWFISNFYLPINQLPIGPLLDNKPNNLDNFTLDEYYMKHDQNKARDPFFKCPLVLRPFSNWCKFVLEDKNFNSNKINKIIYGGVVLIRTNFTKVPLNVWIKMGLTFLPASNIETIHYMERLCHYIFS